MKFDGFDSPDAFTTKFDFLDPLYTTKFFFVHFSVIKKFAMQSFRLSTPTPCWTRSLNATRRAKERWESW